MIVAPGRARRQHPVEPLQEVDQAIQIGDQGVAAGRGRFRVPEGLDQPAQVGDDPSGLLPECRRSGPSGRPVDRHAQVGLHRVDQGVHDREQAGDVLEVERGLRREPRHGAQRRVEPLVGGLDVASNGRARARPAASAGVALR